MMKMLWTQGIHKLNTDKEKFSMTAINFVFDRWIGVFFVDSIVASMDTIPFQFHFNPSKWTNKLVVILFCGNSYFINKIDKIKRMDKHKMPPQCNQHLAINHCRDFWMSRWLLFVANTISRSPRSTEFDKSLCLEGVRKKFLYVLRKYLFDSNFQFDW